MPPPHTRHLLASDKEAWESFSCKAVERKFHVQTIERQIMGGKAFRASQSGPDVALGMFQGDDPALLGAALLHPVSPARMPDPSVYLMFIALADHVQGKTTHGRPFSHHLMEAVHDEARTHFGAELIFALVASGNNRAQRLLRSFDYMWEPNTDGDDRFALGL